MSNYERPSFDKEWWREISKYLKEHPEEGFSENEVKEFIKYVTNKYVNSDQVVLNSKDLEKLRETLKE